MDVGMGVDPLGPGLHELDGGEDVGVADRLVAGFGEGIPIGEGPELGVEALAGLAHIRRRGVDDIEAVDVAVPIIVV